LLLAVLDGYEHGECRRGGGECDRDWRQGADAGQRFMPAMVSERRALSHP
jgi:hypothetical protein